MRKLSHLKVYKCFKIEIIDPVANDREQVLGIHKYTNIFRGAWISAKLLPILLITYTLTNHQALSAKVALAHL